MENYTENIIFEDCDTLETTLTKIVQIYAGSNELKNELKRKGITNYVKLQKGAKLQYILRGGGIKDKLTITL